MTGPDLTWFRLHAATTVIDFPLRLTHTSSQVWAATMWPDPRADHGWHLEPWTPGPQGRGFVPLGVELGDVVEFGVNHAPPTRGPRGRGTPDQVQRWHGYLHAIQPDAIVLHGPHPSPEAAYRAAQLAVMAQIHSNAAVTDAGNRFQPHGRTTQLPTPDTTRTPGLGVPGQPPASLSVTFHGQQATVGDPVHGWLLVDADRLLAAMPYPPERLLRLLTPHLPGLSGREPPLTLAALAARHLPDPLPPPPPAPDTGVHAPSPAQPPHAVPTSSAPNPPNAPTTATGPTSQPSPDPSAEPPIASL